MVKFPKRLRLRRELHSEANEALDDNGRKRRSAGLRRPFAFIAPKMKRLRAKTGMRGGFVSVKRKMEEVLFFYEENLSRIR